MGVVRVLSALSHPLPAQVQTLETTMSRLFPMPAGPCQPDPFGSWESCQGIQELVSCEHLNGALRFWPSARLGD